MWKKSFQVHQTDLLSTHSVCRAVSALRWNWLQSEILEDVKAICSIAVPSQYYWASLNWERCSGSAELSLYRACIAFIHRMWTWTRVLNPQILTALWPGCAVPVFPGPSCSHQWSSVGLLWTMLTWIHCAFQAYFLILIHYGLVLSCPSLKP